MLAPSSPKQVHDRMLVQSSSKRFPQACAIKLTLNNANFPKTDGAVGGGACCTGINTWHQHLGK